MSSSRNDLPSVHKYYKQSSSHGYQDFEQHFTRIPAASTYAGFRSTLVMTYRAIYTLVDASLRRQETTIDQSLEVFADIVRYGEEAIAATADLNEGQPHSTF